MKLQSLIIFFVLASSVYGQSPKWHISFLVQPELTFYKKYVEYNENKDETTPNIGGSLCLQRNVSKRFFVSYGIGFVARTLRANFILDQSALPIPFRSGSNELVTTESFTYRLIPFSFNVGYNFLSYKNTQTFLMSSFVGNYLLNTSYKCNFLRYDGTYKKLYWQGYSINVGVGANFKITSHIQGTTSLSYSLVNSVKQDEYLFVGRNGLKPEYRFLNLSMGLTFPLE